MHSSARHFEACYRWNVESRLLVLLQHINEDPFLGALESGDSLDYAECNYANYMGLGEYAMIMNIILQG